MNERNALWAELTIGSSVFFWNCTSRTRVTCWSSPFSMLSVSSPFKNGASGGGVTRKASSPYTSLATTSCVCKRACKINGNIWIIWFLHVQHDIKENKLQQWHQLQMKEIWMFAYRLCVYSEEEKMRHDFGLHIHLWNRKEYNDVIDNEITFSVFCCVFSSVSNEFRFNELRSYKNVTVKSISTIW